MIQHIWLRLEQLNGQHDDIVKIKGICLFKTGLIFLVYLCESDLSVVSGGLFFKSGGSDELILCGGYCRSHCLWRECLIGNVKSFHAGLDKSLAVIAVVDCEARSIAQLVDLSSEYAHAGRVECGGVYLTALFLAQHFCKSFLQLARSLVCKGDGKYIPRLYWTVRNYIRKP